MKRFKWVFAATLLCAGQASAQSLGTPSSIGDLGGGANSTSGVSLASAAIRSKTEHAMELQLSNGVTFVIDDTLNKIFVDNGQGVQEMNLDAALLAWANGDAARASALRARFRATLNDPMREMSLTSDLLQGSNSMWGSGTTCLSADASCSGDGPEFGSYSAPVSGFQASGWGSYTLTFAALNSPDDEDEDDRRDWERSRLEKCEDAANHLFNVAMAVVGAGAACPFSVTIVAGAACLVAGSTAFWELDNWADDSVACNSPYPGPDGW